MGRRNRTHKPQVTHPIIHDTGHEYAVYTPYNKAWIEVVREDFNGSWDKTCRAWQVEIGAGTNPNLGTLPQLQESLQAIFDMNIETQDHKPTAEQYTTQTREKSMTMCIIEGCGKEATRLKKDGVFTMCNMHYMRQYRKDEPKQDEPKQDEPKQDEPKQEEKPMPKDEPQAQDATQDMDDEQKQALEALKIILGKQNKGMDNEQLQALAERVTVLENNNTKRLAIKLPDMPEYKDCGVQHAIFAKTMQWLAMDENVMLIGASGSGKTTMAHNIANVLERDFYFTGAVLQKYELLGYNDANGNYVETDFYKWYKNGGVFLFDEVDASSASALVAFNAALDNGQCSFPCGMVKRHKDSVCIASGNTYGRGADRQYVGRNQLDGAFMERFIVLTMDYDVNLEKHIANVQNASEQAWFDSVQSWRNACYDLKINHLITPRATIKGIKGLRADMKVKDLEDEVVWKGLEKAQVTKIKQRALEMENK